MAEVSPAGKYSSSLRTRVQNEIIDAHRKAEAERSRSKQGQKSGDEAAVVKVSEEATKRQRIQQELLEQQQREVAAEKPTQSSKPSKKDVLRKKVQDEIIAQANGSADVEA